MQSAHVKKAVFYRKDHAFSPVDFIRITEILLKQTRMRAKHLRAQVNYHVLLKSLVQCLLIKLQLDKCYRNWAPIL